MRRLCYTITCSSERPAPATAQASAATATAAQGINDDGVTATSSKTCTGCATASSTHTAAQGGDYGGHIAWLGLDTCKRRP